MSVRALKLKRPRTAFLIMGALFVGAVIVFWNTEPRARGHSLSTWLAVSEQIESDLSIEEAQAAINEIGDRAVPILLKKLQAKDPAWEEPLYRVCSKVPWLPIRFSWAAEEQEQAIHGFACLGPKARAAIPELTKLLYDTNTTDAVGYALASIGAESLPILRAALTNATNSELQLVAMNATSGSSNIALATLPEMRILRTNMSERLAASAVIRLIYYGPKEEAETVALRALQSGRPQMRMHALRSLTRAGIDKTKSAPVLTGLLNDSDPLFRRSVTNALRLIDPVTAASVGIQTNMLQSQWSAQERPRGRRPRSLPPD